MLSAQDGEAENGEPFGGPDRAGGGWHFGFVAHFLDRAVTSVARLCTRDWSAASGPDGERPLAWFVRPAVTRHDPFDVRLDSLVPLAFLTKRVFSSVLRMASQISRTRSTLNLLRDGQAPLAKDDVSVPLEFRNLAAAVGSNVGRDVANISNLYYLYARDVRRTVSLTLRRASADHDDVCQIVFKNVVEAFKNGKIRFDASGDVGAYIRAVARNVSLDWHRRRRRESPIEELTDWAIPDSQPAIDCEIAHVVLERCLLMMSEQVRELYHLRFVRGFSQHRAASELGMSRQQLRTLETHFMRQLRASMATIGID
jgi:RNA polymerase sigma factor (sigma-70 family)